MNRKLMEALYVRHLTCLSHKKAFNVKFFGVLSNLSKKWLLKIQSHKYFFLRFTHRLHVQTAKVLIKWTPTQSWTLIRPKIANLRANQEGRKKSGLWRKYWSHMRPRDQKWPRPTHQITFLCMRAEKLSNSLEKNCLRSTWASTLWRKLCSCACTKE